MSFGKEIGMLFFVMYWWLLAYLIEKILEKPKIKKLHWIIVGMVNTVIVFSVYTVSNNVLLSYFTIMILMFVEFVSLYKTDIFGSLLCTLSCSAHILSLFMIISGIISLTEKDSLYKILNNGELLELAIVILFIALDVAILLAINLMPLLKIKTINQHKEQQYFINSWLILNNVLLLYTVDMLKQPEYSANMSINQIVVSIVTLISLYIILFFSIKTSAILGYKEKSKFLEQKIQQEQQYRNSMVKDALASYEVNVTQDIVIKGFEYMYKELGDMIYCYSKMAAYISENCIHLEDADKVGHSFTCENILSSFENGQSEITAEYRRLSENESYVWVRAIINLLRDIKTGDIKAFIWIKNIDIEKKGQLELQRMAERDPLTGLYNKAMTAKLVESHLKSNQGMYSSALFMIDVDNFKEINDHLGHVYGDAVLCELADKLVNVFRSNDIVGRIGGDEFMVFLKEGAVGRKAEQKAEEICRAFCVSYKGLNGEEYKVTSSIGISFHPKDAGNFNELYSYADIALYAAKNVGKNTYKLYEGCNFKGYTSQRTEIQAIGGISQKGFKQNRIEYVFKMLYQSENSVAAIHSALELVASHFSFERGYIFETSKDKKTTSNTFEWCASGVTPEIGNLQEIPIEVVATAHSHFEKSGTFILKSLDNLNQIERDVLEPQGIKSMFQFGIFNKSQLLGFIGFDNCRSESIPNDIEIDEITTICNILATFFVKQHIDEVAANDLLTQQEIINHLNNYVYVINTETFEVLFMNERIQKLVKEEENKTTCYSFFRGNTEPCKDCPVCRIISENIEQVICEMYDEKLCTWMEATVSTLRWTDGCLAGLVSCTDITQRKENHLKHIHQLENLVYLDSLTGCRTYNKFKEDAQRVLNKQQNATYLLVKFDINNFKLVNQLYGYEKGNEILCCVAKAMNLTIRNEDEIFARVANDEFIALFIIHELTDIDELNRIFLNHFFSLVGTEFTFKLHFPHGRYVLYTNEEKNMNINDMFEKVNFAHKTAKLSKTSNFIFYDERMTKEALYIKEIENKMASALENDEFIVYLQPKYYLSDETIGGAEALTRWKQENTDLFLPNTFIPIFEKNGFIIKLDFHIFRKACHIIKMWIDSEIEPIVISVNFSRLHLDNVNFVNELCEIVDSVGIHRKYLEIEITETVIFDNIETLEVLLNEIHESGFSMSMDDFGSGYSSLGMLKNLPVDVIKIDRSFFANQKNIERSKTVVGSVIRMAAELGIRTVAEGVEEQNQIDILRELKCDMVQGYYYAKPMPEELFTELITKQDEVNNIAIKNTDFAK